jgi:hypothetical protein
VFTPHATLKENKHRTLPETIPCVIVATVYGERFNLLSGSAENTKYSSKKKLTHKHTHTHTQKHFSKQHVLCEKSFAHDRDGATAHNDPYKERERETYT